MVVAEDGALPLPWLAQPLQSILKTQQGHALLLQSSSGDGALQMALVLAQAWLCEAPATSAKPCGRCGSCRLIQSHLHPDLRVLLPETLRREHGWPLADDKPDSDDSKRKPSKQIRIDEVRSVIDWVFKTSARGQGKVMVLHPADALNVQSANALLKTLEEPPAGTRMILSAADPSLLLPTVRSRCQHVLLPPVAPDLASGWLIKQGVNDPELLLAACSGRPLDVVTLTQDGVSAQTWAELPGHVAQGRAAAFAGWPVPRVIDALHKLCHDAMARSCGAPARFFPSQKVPSNAGMAQLVSWQHELARVARHEDHPWNEALLIEALTIAAAQALARPGPRTKSPGVGSFDTLGIA